MRKLVFFIALAAALVGGWRYGSPYWTLYQMREAAADNDGAAFNAYVDYPALRESMKAELMAEARAEAEAAGTGALAEFGIRMAEAVLGPVIDAAVTEEAVSRAFTAKDRAEEWKLPVIGGKGDAMPTIDRDGFSTFTARGPESETGFVFERRGVSWTLVGIEVPRA